MQVAPHSTSKDTRRFISSVSPKGQITLPKQLREVLGVKSKGKVAIRLEDDEIKVTPVTATLESIYQSVPALKRPLTDREVSDIAHEEHAQEVAQEGL